jgi:oxygen-independent coproporphyrinogen-3 oxidase
MPNNWLERVAQTGTGMLPPNLQDPLGHATEYVLTAVRLAEGIDIQRLKLLGLTLPEDAVEDLVKEGLVNRSETKLVPTQTGRALADGIAHYLSSRAIPAFDMDSQS